MAHEGQKPIVGCGVEHLRQGPQSGGKRHQPFGGGTWGVAGGRQQPRPSFEQVGARVLEPARRGSSERVPADEGEPRRELFPGRNDLALRAAGIGDDHRAMDVVVELAQQGEILTDRRRQDDQVDFREHNEIVCRHVDGVQAHCGLEDVLVVDSNDERARPELPCRQRNRPADQAEPDDADAREDRRGSRAGGARLDDGKLHTRACQLPQPRRATGSRQMLRPIAGAIMRSSAISRSNWAGNIDWAPSLSAWSGSQCTSMSNPSAPAATAARAIGATMSRLPAP
jgi:hypothetical protein